MSQHITACLILASWVLYQSICVFAATHRLDLSHQFHMTPSTISDFSGKFIDSIVDSGSVDDSGNNSNVTIDLSNSNLGDQGLEQVISSIVVGQGKLTNRSMTLDMHFKAQMNGLSSSGVAEFLNRIMKSSSSKTTRNATAVDSHIDPMKWRCLDFGWNPLYSSASSLSNHKPFHTAISNMLHNDLGRMKGLHTLCLSCTGLGPTGCRILAKSLLRRYDIPEEYCKSENRFAPISLYLSYNRDIGDAGAASFAALIRSFMGNETDAPIFDTLDLSACDIGDVGVEAIALALEDAPASVLIRNLVLCHNRISDQGALSLGRAIHRNVFCKEMHVDLSDNPLITDQGISSLFSAVEKGCLASLKLRSCSIQADGTELIGKMLRTVALNKNHGERSISIDISGNPVGILRGKSEKSSMYSASILKSKASATASAYMSQGLSFLKKGLGGVGISSSVESDDEEEKQQSVSRNSMKDSDKSKNMRCGFKSLANAFLEGDTSSCDSLRTVNSPMTRICLGLRRTFCDSAGADALAAMLSASKDCFVNVKLDFELDLNPVVEDEMIDALLGRNDDLLMEMSERHTEAMEVLQLSRERAVVASRDVGARRKKIPSSFSNDEEMDADNYSEVVDGMHEPVVNMDSYPADSDAEYEDEFDDF